MNEINLDSESEDSEESSLSQISHANKDARKDKL
jgi:hypothetical protein